MTIADLTAASPSVRVRAAYRRIAEVDRPEIWISLRPESDVTAEAVAIETRVAAGEALPLAGVLVAVKDNVDVAGLPTTAGCPAYGYSPNRTAPAVQRLIDAGALVLGKTNLDQFATGLVGTRSPYGVVRHAFDPERISGGSSSGSAVAVALRIADVGIGTDTAGSGRVPAALNGIVGIKPTLGLVPTRGVVPAARPYDCVSVFARTLADAQRALAIMTGPDSADPRSRTWPSDVRLAGTPDHAVAVPDHRGLSACTPAVRAAFDAAADRLRGAGRRVVEIDIDAFLAAATLLYGSAIVAERFAAVGAFVDGHADQTDPTVRRLIMDGARYSAVDLADAQDQVGHLRAIAEQLLEGCDALMLPTTPGHPTIDEVLADPIGLNGWLGTYTNFVNLLDLSAVSVPVAAGSAPTGSAPAGVTFVGRAFDDQVVLDLAAELLGEGTPLPYPPVAAHLVVFGAHMQGEPLNGQLRRLGARFIDEVHTAPRYRMVALEGPVPKPGIVHDPVGGAVLTGERWALSPAGLGAFLAMLPDPMRLGPLELADGTTAIGFHCDRQADASRDITAFGSWRMYLRRDALDVAGNAGLDRVRRRPESG